MTDVRERRVGHTELTLVAFSCARCGVEVTLDLAQDKQRQALLRNLDPLVCPVCGQTFDRYVREALRAFQDMREKLAAAGVELIFRIPEARQL